MQYLDAPYHAALPILLKQRAQGGLPPHGALGVIRCDSASRQQGLDFLQQISHGVATLRGCQLIGPLPAAMARRKNRYRAQLVVSSVNRAMLAAMMTSLVQKAESLRQPHQLSWSVDIDPYESL